MTDPRGVNCLSDEPSTFHAVQSSALQFASLTELQVKMNRDLERKHGKTVQS